MNALPSSLLLLAFAVIAFNLMSRQTRGLDSLRADARRQFDGWLTTPAAQQMGLAPGRCELVQQSETFRRGEGEICNDTLTLFLRSPAGHCVMFKSTPTGPYVKLVAPQVAKAVLKRRYVPPSA